MPNYNHAPKEINPHYNREFELLMSGKKKIAVFSTGFFADSDWPDTRYDDAVNDGILGTKTYVQIYRNREIKTVYYFLPNHEDLAQKIEDLYALTDEARGSEAVYCEEQIGKTLGYSDHEIACWIEHFNIADETPKDPLIGPHEERELELMLKGEKPLTEFSDIVEPERGGAILVQWSDQEFTPHVESGEIIRHEIFHNTPDGQYEIHSIYFTLPGEEWRAKELHKLRTTDFTVDMNDYYDRKVGELLGYPKEAIDHFIQRRKLMSIA
ncbi:hypothetical protein [Curvivirga sp.]|uniref:hypothetical protein n=1 Tax=Curvivirga sp. TaxID=2856848 RepID=UPI003B5BD0A7